MDKHLENAKTLATSDGAILFPHPDEITLTQQGEGKAIRVQLSGNQFIVISMEAESGRYIVNESGDLGGATRGVRWKSCQKHINQTPMSFLELCWRVRHAATIENIETRANLLGIHTFRQRNLRAATLTQFGVHTGVVYLQLADFPQHYVAIISSHAGLKFALVELQEHLEYGMGTGEYYISDFGWVQAEKFFQLYSQEKNDVQGDEMDIDLTTDLAEGKVLSGQKRKRPQGDVGIRLPPDHVPATRDPLDLSVQEIRDLHAYCRARVAHTLIESQLKARNIPYIHVRPPLSGPRLPIPKAPAGSKVPVAQQKALETLRRRQLISKSPLEAYLPILSVRSSDLLAGAAAAEAAMPNIRIEPIEWWSLDKDCMVNTSVQLKYVQPLDQPRGSKGAPNGKIICPSENISYDTRTSVITFLSRKVSDCVDEFLKEWARVSKVVVIARQISLMPDKKGWKDVRILSFDLQTVEFAYCRDYSLSITSVDGIYRLSFSRCSPLSSNEESMKMSVDTTNAAELQRNAHQDCAKFAQELLKDDRLGASVFELVGFLRNTVNVVEMFDMLEEEESVRSISANQGSRFDVLVKATGWWRIRYSLSTLFASSEEAKSFALDVRLIKGRIMLVDGSVDLGTGKIAVHSPMSMGTAASVGTTTATTGGAGSNGGTGPGATASASSSNTGAGTSSSQRTLPVPLLPINKMEEYVSSVLEEVGKEAEVSADGVYPVNYGLAIICGCAGAPKLMKALHEKILGGL
ncbi:mediator complex subunit [Serendipita sp. 400]|nr:mediator complex subunit [Serendipita sp. 400]